MPSHTSPILIALVFQNWCLPSCLILTKRSTTHFWTIVLPPGLVSLPVHPIIAAVEDTRKTPPAEKIAARERAAQMFRKQRHNSGRGETKGIICGESNCWQAGHLFLKQTSQTLSTPLRPYWPFQNPPLVFANSSLCNQHCQWHSIEFFTSRRKMKHTLSIR